MYATGESCEPMKWATPMVRSRMIGDFFMLEYAVP